MCELITQDCQVLFRFTLQYLDLRDNRIHSLSELWFLARCIHLQELFLSRGRQTNPVCKEFAYVPTILSVLPQLRMLDNRLLLPANPGAYSKYSRHLDVLSTSKIPLQRNAEQIFGTLCRRLDHRGHQNHTFNVYLPTDFEKRESWFQKNSFLANALHSSFESPTSLAKVHKVDRACSPRLPSEHSVSSQSLPQQGFLHEVCSCEPFLSKGSEKLHHRYCQNDPQEIACFKRHHKRMPSSTLETVRHNSLCKIDHDFIGFHKKKRDIPMPHTYGLTGEQLEYLNALDARLRSLESRATLQGSNRVDDGIASKADAPQVHEKVEQQYNNTQCTPTKILLVQLVAAKGEVIVDNINVRIEDMKKETYGSRAKILEECIEDIPMETANTGETDWKNCSIETSSLTQRDITSKQDKQLAFAEGGHLRQPIQTSGLTSEKGLGEAPKDQEIFQLQKELKEKDAELLKYKQGLTKLEEILQEKEILNSGLLQQKFLEAVAFAKAEKAVLKEALDAEKLSHQVEAVLKDIAIERNQYRKYLSTLSREATFKIQQLSSELESCKIKESENLSEVKRLSALLNLERIQFQGELHDIERLFKTLATQRPPLVEQPNKELRVHSAISPEAASEKLAEMQKDGRICLQADRSLQSQSLKTHSMENLGASKQLKNQLGKVKEEMQSLRVQAMRSDELEKEINLLHSQFVEAKNFTQDLNRELDHFKSEKASLLEEKKSLSSVLVEKAQKVESLEDALRVKNKMLDSQNDSIKELKSNVSDLKKQLVEKTAALESVEANFRRQLQEEAEQVHRLRVEIAEQDVVISELEEELQGHKQAKAAAETSKVILEKRLAEKDDMLRYIKGEIERVQDLYENREKALTVEKDKAVDSIQHLTREKNALQAELEDLLKQKNALEEKENTLREAFDRQGKQMSELNVQLSSVRETLEAETNAREKMKSLYCSKVSQLCKALEELQNVEVLTEEPSDGSANLSSQVVPKG